jgi:hypothetical protein
VDTRTRLKEQRNIAWRGHGSIFGLGLVLGLLIGYGSSAVSPRGFAPNWAYFLLAYVLGMLSVVLFWWLAGLRREPPQDRSTDKA